MTRYLLMLPRTVPPLTLTAVVVAVIAISSSAPMIAYAAAPALAIAFWRNALAVGALAPYAGTRRHAELTGLTRGTGRRDGLYCVLAGLALAAHFACWIPSPKLTTVAAAVALGATQPIWQGIIATCQGRRLSPATWLGIGVAVTGAILATGADFTADSLRAVGGDLLAVAGGIAAAVYTALGERARTTTSTTSYTLICYAVCAVVLGLICLISGVPLTGFPPTAWLIIVGLTIGPQLLGHSLLNYALERVSATTISIVILLEVPGAALLAWLWLGQTPRLAALPGLLLLVSGVAVVVLGGARRAARTPDPAAEAGATL